MPVCHVVRGKSLTSSTAFKMHFIYITLAVLRARETRIVNTGTKTALTQFVVLSKFKLHHREQFTNHPPITVTKVYFFAFAANSATIRDQLKQIRIYSDSIYRLYQSMTVFFPFLCFLLFHTYQEIVVELSACKNT